MRKIDLQSLIDRVIGKEGILRVPSYWVRKLFNQVLDYTDESVAKSAETTEANAITSATATSKEYTDQQISELGITGKEPIVYALPQGTLTAMSYMGNNEYTYKFTEDEANEYINALNTGLDKVVIMCGADNSLLIPLSPAAGVLGPIADTLSVIAHPITGSIDGEWFVWRVYFYIDYDSTTGNVECRRLEQRDVINIQGIIDSSIGDINTILDNINGEEV